MGNRFKVRLNLFLIIYDRVFDIVRYGMKN